MTSLLRQWPMLEAVLLPALMCARPLERLIAWNLGSLDDALALSLLYFYCLKDRGFKELRIYHSGSPPGWQPIEWRVSDIRTVPRGRWVEPLASRGSRWAPHREVMERVLLGEPPGQVDLLVAGVPGPTASQWASSLRLVRPGGHVLLTSAFHDHPVPAEDFERVDREGRLFRRAGGRLPRQARTGDCTRAGSRSGSRAGRTLARHNDEATLVASYMNLARALARRFHNRGERPEDLEQVAVLALVKAAGRYSEERGSFGGFATSSVLGELKRHFRDRMWMVRVPRSIQEMHLAIRAARDELYQQRGHSPTISEIADHIGATDDAVLAAMEAAENCWPASLDAPVRDGEDGVTDVAVLDEGYDRSLNRRLLQEAIPRLSPTEKLIVRRLYFDGCTQRQVAEEIGVSQMQISRIMARTMGKLRESFDPA